MSAFMLQIVGRNKRDAALTSRSHDLYGQSLGALQKALNHPVAWKATETLAATILCCLYEVRRPHRAQVVLLIADWDGEAFCRHSRHSHVDAACHWRFQTHPAAWFGFLLDAI